MSDYTTDELIKANRVHADLHAGCQECPLYEERVCTSPKLQTYSADRLEAQQKEISDLKKQIAETYTAEQFIQDARRMIDKDYPAWLVRHMTDNPQDESNYVREWAASHPEKPKVTNGDKFKEVFGKVTGGICFRQNPPMCIHSENDDFECDDCEFGVNGEYKEPSDK